MPRRARPRYSSASRLLTLDSISSLIALTSSRLFLDGSSNPQSSTAGAERHESPMAHPICNHSIGAVDHLPRETLRQVAGAVDRLLHHGLGHHRVDAVDRHRSGGLDSDGALSKMLGERLSYLTSCPNCERRRTGRASRRPSSVRYGGYHQEIISPARHRPCV